MRLGADAVGYTLYVGSLRQADEIRHCEVRRDCERLGMPFVMWSYPRDDAAVLRKLRFYMECGAAGVMFGRNMWLRPFEDGLTLTRAAHRILRRFSR